MNITKIEFIYWIDLGHSVDTCYGYNPMLLNRIIYTLVLQSKIALYLSLIWIITVQPKI